MLKPLKLNDLEYTRFVKSHILLSYFRRERGKLGRLFDGNGKL